MKLSQARSRTRRYLHETESTNSFWSNDLLDQIINAQYLLRCSELISAHEGYFVLKANRSIVPGQSRYALPAQLQRLLKLEIKRTDGRTIPLKRFERHEEYNPAETTADETYLPTYRVIGNSILLEPPVSSSTPSSTQQLVMEFNQLPARLQADNDELHPDFPAIFDELIVLDTAVAAMDAEGVLETGNAKTILRLRQEWELRWERFIDSRIIARQVVSPFFTGADANS